MVWHPPNLLADKRLGLVYSGLVQMEESQDQLETYNRFFEPSTPGPLRAELRILRGRVAWRSGGGSWLPAIPEIYQMSLYRQLNIDITKRLISMRGAVQPFRMNAASAARGPKFG